MRKSYMPLIALSTLITLSGCPGDSCEKNSDCDSDESCVTIHTDAEPDGHLGCLPNDLRAGSKGGGYSVTKVEVGTGGVNVTVEKDKQE